MSCVLKDIYRKLYPKQRTLFLITKMTHFRVYFDILDYQLKHNLYRVVLKS